MAPEPTERSTPAVSRTKVIPTARMPVDEACVRMFSAFFPVKKVGDITPKTSTTSANRIGDA